MEREKLGTKEIDSIMNKNSGMLGLTETSNDMREIEQEAARGSERHKLAIDIYCYTIKKYIGAYMAALGGVDGIIFTGGIGENSRLVRRLVLEGMEPLGVAMDAAKNEANGPDISAGKVKVLVVPTNEELAIARDTKTILESMGRTADAPAPAPAARKAEGFTPEETAELVQLWAKSPKAEPEALAAKLGPKLGRTIEAAAVRRELERLSLLPSPKNPKTN
jgi:acetate kinase